MYIATRGNAISYSMIVIALHVMPCPNFRITYELFTNVRCQMCAQGDLSKGSI